MSAVATNQANLDDSNALTVFTFWIGDELFAIDIGNILSITQDLDSLLKTPVKSKGLTGIINYLGNPVAVYNFAEMLNIPSTREMKSRLVELLDAREKEHLDWVDALEKSLKNDESFNDMQDSHMSTFGKWCDKFETRDEALTDIMARFEEPHQKLHALAKELIELKKTGQLELALDKLQLARTTTLNYLKKNFSHARNQIQESLHTVVINITNDGIKPVVALQIDEIHEVMNFTKTDLVSLEQIGLDAIEGMEGYFRGYLSGDDNKSSCLLLDTKNILSNIKAI